MPSASHPERPHRLAAIAQHLVVKELFQRCIRINGRLARRSELATVHTEDHCDMIMSLENVGPEGYSFGADTCVTSAATAPPLATPRDREGQVAFSGRRRRWPWPQPSSL